MNLLRRFLGLFRDSPTYGRDRANLISGFSIGTAGLLLNGAVLMLVLPLMLDPDDRDFQVITENVEFGQLLGLILLGGAAAFATFLIPLRLTGVFWGPRVGRYFDQIVLSGITPLRFLIGKATSQILFLGLILFLLLPYMVLSLTLGGVEPGPFIAGVFLVWLYCMALALVTLWVSLYLNDLLAALAVMGAMVFFAAMGCIPMFGQSFVMTPFPALIHPLYSELPFLDGYVANNFMPIFLSCAVGMSILIVVSLIGIYLGPLYGIIRENSTFGEVVRPGDSKKKRWFRLRQHIQRPSEIAFFYEKRGDAFRRNEGLLRWGLGFLCLLLLAGGARFFFGYMLVTVIAPRGAGSQWWVYEFHTSNLVIHGFSMLFAVVLFSHARNTTFQKIPLVAGWRARVSVLDTIGFVAFALVSIAASIGMPFWYEINFVAPGGQTVFPDLMYVSRGREVDYLRVAIEGSIVITISALVVYGIHRVLCLTAWLRTTAIFGTSGVYFMFLCLFPMAFAILYFELPEWRSHDLFANWAPQLSMMSPMATMAFLFSEMGPDYKDLVTTTPFYILHIMALLLVVVIYFASGKKLRQQYLTTIEEAK